MSHFWNILQRLSRLCQKFCTGLCLHILLLSIALGLLQIFQSDLLFQRDAINKGQVWLLLTGNLVHTNTNHLLMNLAGLSFICFLFKDFISLKLFYISLFITILFVGTGLYFFNPELIWYAGLSGSLYGLYIVAASSALIHKDYLTGLPILIAIPAKIAWDSQHTELTDSSAELIGAPVATDAHIYGLIAGILISIAIISNAFFSKKTPN